MKSCNFLTYNVFISLVTLNLFCLDYSYANTCGHQSLKTQSEVDAFYDSGCDSIIGNLVIGDCFSCASDISNLFGLGNLKYVEGSVLIYYTQLGTLIGLDNLIEITGSLRIYGNSNLNELNGLYGLQKTGSYIQIYDNPNLSILQGLNNLKETSDLDIYSNATLFQINDLDNLERVSGLMDIENNPGLSSISIPKLSHIGGRLSISGNQNLSSVSLPKIKLIGGELKVVGNLLFDDCCFIIPWKERNVIYGSLTISSNGGGCASIFDVYTTCDAADSDRDGITNSLDNCENVFNPGQEDFDGDGVGNPCDNCPKVSNPSQEDSNNNFIGNDCEIIELGKLGINTNLPSTGLELLASDLFLNDPKRGLILKNFNGACFRLYLDENGQLMTKSITCPDE